MLYVGWRRGGCVLLAGESFGKNDFAIMNLFVSL